MHTRWPGLGRAVIAFGAAALLVACHGGDGGDQKPDDDGGGSTITYDRAAVTRAYVVMHSCGVEQKNGIATYLRDYESIVMYGGMVDLVKAQHLCVLKAGGDCAKVLDCFGSKPSDPECDMSYKGTCEGNTRVFCDLAGKRIYRHDCAAGGMVCATDGQGEPFCAEGSCSEAGKSICKGDRRLVCNGNGYQVEACDVFQLRCALNRDKIYDCTGTGKQCKG